MDSIALDALVGEHDLSGVDHDTVSVPQSWRDADSANCIRFVLDGVTYVATEDPEDGYRSCLGSLIIDKDARVTNRYPPVRVLVRKAAKSSDGWGGEPDYLEFIRISDGVVVLEVGTDNIDDYYPGFVGRFYPDRMGPVIPPPDPVIRSTGRRFVLDDD